MDYSKVNSALNGWVGSGARRDRAQAELGQAMQLQQAQSQMQANEDAKTQEMDQWMQHIHDMSSQVAIRNEDKERIQAMYDQEKDTFLSELEKSGNDPIKFMNSGGRKTMKNFYNNIAFSEDAQRIKGNTTQIQAFYEQLEGSNGENAHLIPNQVRREFDAFMNGNIDTFKHRGLTQWDEPKDDVEGNTKVDRFLNQGSNLQKFRTNYMQEYQLSEGEAMNVSIDELRKYAASYVGGINPEQSLIPSGELQVSKAVSGRIQRQHRKLKSISTSLIGKGSQDHKTALGDYDMGGFEYGMNPENTEIMGNRGFVGDELDMAKASLGVDRVVDLDGYIPDVKAKGIWYDEDGGAVIPGDDLGDVRPGAIFMGYKVKQSDGSYKLVKAEDLEGEPKDAEHALIQEYESDDVLWFNSYFYNEIDPNDAKTMSVYESLKAGESAGLARYTAGASFEQPAPTPLANIGLESSVEEISSQLPNYDAKVNRVMQTLGLGEKRKDNTTKSILLSLAALDGDMDKGIGGLSERFNNNDFPELNNALMEGDSTKFFNAYYKVLMEMGASSEEASSYLQMVDQLRNKIQKA
tara:strand:- start:117 stop:1850 length:1734 start_codon:yes stop_codon:yes gene_type:complete